MVRLSQRWCGASTPVNMLHADDLELFYPLDSSAPQAAHMLNELRSLGYSLVMGLVNEPYAAGDATIYDVLLTAAGVLMPSTCDSLVAGRFSFGFWCWWALAN